jgi:hypothetical protein
VGGVRHECAVRPEDLGPFLLGQLGPDQAALVAESIKSCPSCTLEVERLVPVAAAISRVSLPLEDAASAPSPALERVLKSVRSEQAASRRRLRTRVTLAAASVVLLLAAVVGALVTGGDDNDGRDIALTSQSSAWGKAMVAERGWGTAISLDLGGLKPGETYGAWLADSKGERVPAGTFRPTANGTVHLDLGASMTLTQASTMGVTQRGGADVLTADLGAKLST